MKEDSETFAVVLVKVGKFVNRFGQRLYPKATNQFNIF